MDNVKLYSRREERANAFSHLLGVFLVLTVSFFLFKIVLPLHDFWATLGFGLMTCGLTSSYLASTLYHSATDPVRKARLRRFDHAAIYLNIAGSYTPFALYVLRNEGGWGWSLFAAIWLSALVGIAMNFRPMKRNSHLKTASYLLMGWMVMIAFKPLYDVLSREGRVEAIYWVVAEGILYTVGALFYMFAKREFMHTVFHLFVLAACACHLYALYLVVA